MGFPPTPSGSSRRADFTATSWTIVMEAGEGISAGAREALEQLCQTYWYPLYVFIRRQGLSPTDAEDVTQGFFGKLLEKSYLKDVNRERGRFRSFLLASIKHYLLNEIKHAKRLKRGGGRPIISFDQVEAESLFAADNGPADSPERALDRSWATTVMSLAMKRLAQEYKEAEKESFYQAAGRFLSEEPAPGEYDTLASEFGMSKNALGVAVHRLRKRYGELIRSEIANTVAHPFEVDDEMRYLYTVLSGEHHA